MQRLSHATSQCLLKTQQRRSPAVGCVAKNVMQFVCLVFLYSCVWMDDILNHNVRRSLNSLTNCFEMFRSCTSRWVSSTTGVSSSQCNCQKLSEFRSRHQFLQDHYGNNKRVLPRASAKRRLESTSEKGTKRTMSGENIERNFRGGRSRSFTPKLSRSILD